MPSAIACSPSSPGRINWTAACKSPEVIVCLPLYWASLEASMASLSNKSLQKEFMTFTDFLDMPTVGWMFFRTL